VAVILLQGLAGVIDGIGYYRYIRSHLKSSVAHWTPFASVLLHCKGLDYELEKNVDALLHQDYPHYQGIFVTASEGDPAARVLRSLAAKAPHRKVKVLTAGVSEERGEKVHNLIQATGKIAPESVVHVFTDSDSRAPSDWLRELVAPLQDQSVGACTGYLW